VIDEAIAHIFMGMRFTKSNAEGKRGAKTCSSVNEALRSSFRHNGFGIGAVSNVETASRFGLGKFRSSATASKFRPSLIAPNAMIAEVARV